MLDYFELNVVKRVFDLYHWKIMYQVVNLKINLEWYEKSKISSTVDKIFMFKEA